MESESIVDYLKSSLGKPWPLVANSSPNNNSNSNSGNISTTTASSENNTTTSAVPISTINHKQNSISQTNNHDPGPKTNGKNHILRTDDDSLSSPISQTTTPPSPLRQQQQPLPTSPHSPANPTTIKNNLFTNHNCINAHTSNNHSATQLDGLYPEWDEFYLLVCDICGIIIRPQALGKHLVNKHRISVQTTTNITSTTSSTASTSSSSTTTTAATTTTTTTTTSSTPITNNAATNNTSTPSNNTKASVQISINHKQSSISQPQPNNHDPGPKTNGKNHVSRNDPISTLSHIPPSKNLATKHHRISVQQTTSSSFSSSTAVPTSSTITITTNTNNHNNNHSLPNNLKTSTSTTATTNNNINNNTNETQHNKVLSRLWGGKNALDSLPKPAIKAPSTSARYQDRKWRNTFNVLKDAFL